MNRLSKRRFTKGFSSGLFIWAVFTLGYTPHTGMISAHAADNLEINQSKSSQSDFKNLPEHPGAITSKQKVESSDSVPAKETLVKPTAVDENKGIAAKVQKESNPEEVVEYEEIEPEEFQATAYCLKGRTASGEYVREGIIAADPRVLPIGTVVHIKAGRYTGTYTVKDTGGLIKGRKVDIYIPNYKEAKAFGKRRVKIKVLKPKPNSARKN